MLGAAFLFPRSVIQVTVRRKFPKQFVTQIATVPNHFYYSSTAVLSETTSVGARASPLARLRVRVRLVVNFHQLPDRGVRVFLRRRQRLVPQQLLNRSQIRAIRQQMRRECVAQGMRVQVPIDVRQLDVLLYDSPHRTLRQPPARVIQKRRIGARRRPPHASTAGGLQQELFPKWPVFVQRLLRLRPVRHDAFLVALPAHAQHLLFPLHVFQVQARELAHTQSRGIEQLQQRAIAAQQQSFSARSSPLRCTTLTFLRRQTSACRSRPCVRQVIQKSIHLFRGKHRRNSLRQLRRRHEPRRIVLDHPFAHAILEKRTQRRQLPRDRTLLQPLLVQMSHKFADDQVRNLRQRRWLLPRRRKIRHELLQVVPIIQNRVRRGVPYRLQVLQIFLNGLLHLSGAAPRAHQSIVAQNRASTNSQMRAAELLTGTYGFAPTGVAASSGCAGIGSATTDSQSQPSFKQLRTVPILVFFSTMNGAPHFGQGSANGICSVVKLQSGYREQP